jgi:glycine/D-amino acid oxidase-like deaminating enzyme
MKAHIVGGGFSGLAAAVCLIRNAGTAGQDITIYEPGEWLVVPSRSGRTPELPLLSADLIHRAGSRLYIVEPSCVRQGDR